MKVCVLGASGLVGRHLTHALAQRGDTVVEASLRDPVAAAASAAQCGAVVNLAGEPIAQRWTAAVKRRLEQSRVDLPRRFLDELAKRDRVTTAYVSASAVGYYGDSETATFVESDPPGSDFLARICIEWEREAARAREFGLRVAIVRSGIALATDGGALEKMLLPFRAGAGGPLGTGRQQWSWIHIDDLVAVYLLVLDGGDGPINATAPNPVTNAQFATALGAALHRPALLPTPAFALRLLLGEGANFALTGQRVLPERLTHEYGFAFAFPELNGALANLLGTAA